MCEPPDWAREKERPGMLIRWVLPGKRGGGTWRGREEEREREKDGREKRGGARSAGGSERGGGLAEGQIGDQRWGGAG